MMRHRFGSREVVCLAGASFVAAAILALAGCADSKKSSSSRVDRRLGVSASPRVIQPGQPVPKGGGRYSVGKPYVVAGRTYYPTENRRYRAEGIASWYGDDFHGRLTANGEIYDMESISAAHPTLPIPSYARVTNLHNGRSIIVRVNDRGPYHDNRIIDLSSKTAQLLELRRAGTGRVRVEYVGAAALEGSDDRRLLATLSDRRPAPPPSTVRVASSRPFTPASERPPVAERPPAPAAAALRPVPRAADRPEPARPGRDPALAQPRVAPALGEGRVVQVAPGFSGGPVAMEDAASIPGYVPSGAPAPLGAGRGLY
jgi:rare lipoprotein A